MKNKNTLTPEEFARITRAARKFLGLRQREFGKLMNRSVNTISRWENAEVPPLEPELIVQEMRKLVENHCQKKISAIFDPQHR